MGATSRGSDLQIAMPGFIRIAFWRRLLRVARERFTAGDYNGRLVVDFISDMAMFECTSCTPGSCDRVSKKNRS